MPEPMLRRRPQGPTGRADTLLPIQVRYYKRMYRGKTYPVEVCWKSAERGVAVKPVTLRLEVAGALVVPSEHVLRPADPEDKVTFYVTPLSTGKLRHHVIELHHLNVKVFEMPLKAKVGTQRFTLFLLIMTFLAPWLLTRFCTTPYQKDGLPPAESMTALIKNILPDLTELDDLAKDYVPIKEWLDKGAEYTGTGYGELCDWCRAYPIASYTGLSLFVLTLLTFLWRLPKRKRRTSDPIDLSPQGPG